MNKDKILAINVLELIQKSLGSFNDIYGKLAVIQQRLTEKDDFSDKEKERLSIEYKLFRDEVARRIENCRQMTYKRSKYAAWYEELKGFYEKLPVAIDF